MTSLHLSAIPQTPSLTASDVDGEAEFVADPFLVRTDDMYHLFCEVMLSTEERGVIGHTWSETGKQWSPIEIALDEPFHLSFPAVIATADGWLMTPGNTWEGTPQTVKVYHATNQDFPTNWELIAEPITAHKVADPILFQWGDHWHLLFSESKTGPVWLYSASSPLASDWALHPAAPISTHARAGRPGGRPFVLDGTLHIPFQDSRFGYGEMLRCFAVELLTRDDFVMTETDFSPLLRAQYNHRWTHGAMHHADLRAALADEAGFVPVDGRGPEGKYAIGFCELTRAEPSLLTKAGRRWGRRATRDLPELGCRALHKMVREPTRTIGRVRRSMTEWRSRQ